MMTLVGLMAVLACNGTTGTQGPPLTNGWDQVTTAPPIPAEVRTAEANEITLDYGTRTEDTRKVGEAWIDALEHAGWAMDDTPVPMGPALGWRGKRGEDEISLFAAPSKGHLTVTLLRK
jgi:hypothetical protein